MRPAARWASRSPTRSTSSPSRCRTSAVSTSSSTTRSPRTAARWSTARSALADHVAGAVPHRRRRSVHRRRPRDGSPHVDRRRVRQVVTLPRGVPAGRRHVVHAQRREGGHRRQDLRNHAVRGQPATSRSPRRGTRSIPALLTPLEPDVDVPPIASALPGGSVQRSGAGVRAGAHQAGRRSSTTGATCSASRRKASTGRNQATTAYYVEVTLPGTDSPQFVLLQTFSPGASGSGTSANNMTAWLAAECDYTTHERPEAGVGAPQQRGQRARSAAVRQQHQHQPDDQLADQPAQPARIVGHPRQRHRPAVQQRLLPVHPPDLRHRRSQRRHRVPAVAGCDRRHPERDRGGHVVQRRRCRRCSTPARRFPA